MRLVVITILFVLILVLSMVFWFEVLRVATGR